jgi:hypothetical protein
VVKSGLFFYRIDASVTTRDAQGNLLGEGGDQINILVDGSPTTVRDNGNGTYTMDPVITLNPNPTVDITLNGVPISGSPYRP